MKNKNNMHFLLFALLSCSNDDISLNKPASEYFPNKVGNYWEYSVIDSTGTSEGVQRYTLTITVVGTKVMADGKQALIWKYQFPSWVRSNTYPNDGVDTVYVRTERDSVKTFAEGYTNMRALKFPYQIFPIPFEPNQKWNGKLYWIDTYAVSQDSADVYSISYHYVGPNIEYIDKLYFTPNIGFIKMDKSHYDLAPIDHQIWQLQKYSLK